MPGLETQIVTTKDLYSTVQGVRFVANNPTPGTGIAGHAAPTTYDQTKPFFYLFNPASNPKTVYPQRLRFLVTVISTGGTGSKFTFSRDVGDLYSSGGTELTRASCHAATQPSGVTRLLAGDVVATAAVASKLIANCTPRGAVIETVWDEYQFVFGGVDGSVTCASNTGAAAQISSSFGLPPVAIPPGYCLKVVQWKASQSAGPTMEVFVDWLEV